MRAHHGVSLLLIVFSLLTLVAASNAHEPQHYLIEAKLNTTHPNGQNVLSCPRVVVTEGNEARIHIGDQLAPPREVGITEPFQLGTSSRFKVFRKDGRLFVDATVNRSSGKSNLDEANISTVSVRVIKAITSGKKITEVDGDLRLELVVYELQPDSDIASENARHALRQGRRASEQ